MSKIKLPLKTEIDLLAGTSTEIAEKIQLDEINGQVGDLTYVHNQATASATWLVVHNLGKQPTVLLIDSAGDSFMAMIEKIDDNSFNVVMNAACGGKAYCN